MNGNSSPDRLSALMLPAVLALLPFVSGCGDSAPAALLKNPKGKIEVRNSASAIFKEGRPNDPVRNGGAVRTFEDGEGEIHFAAGGIVKLWPDSHFEVKAGNSFGRQVSGDAKFDIPPGPVIRTIETPHGTTAILGTVFMQRVATKTIEIYLDEGEISFTAAGMGTKVLHPGQQLIATAEEPIPEPASMPGSIRDLIFKLGTPTGINPR